MTSLLMLTTGSGLAISITSLIAYLPIWNGSTDTQLIGCRIVLVGVGSFYTIWNWFLCRTRLYMGE